MGRSYDKPITVQVIDQVTEEWSDYKKLHAYINKTAEREDANVSAIVGKRSLTFEVRFISALETIATNTQLYRIIYRGVPYNIIGYDDFQERHKTIKFRGVSY